VRNLLLLNTSLLLVNTETLHHLLRLNRGLLQLGLHISQRDLHLLDRRVRPVQLVQPPLQPLHLPRQLLPLLLQNLLVNAQQFQIARGSHIRVPPQLRVIPDRVLLHRLMDILEHPDQLPLNLRVLNPQLLLTFLNRTFPDPQ